MILTFVKVNFLGKSLRYISLKLLDERRSRILCILYKFQGLISITAQNIFCSRILTSSISIAWAICILFPRKLEKFEHLQE